VPKFLDVLQTILKLRKDIRTHKAFPVAPTAAKAQSISSLKDLHLGQPRQEPRVGKEFLREQLDALISKSFLREVTFARLQHFPRYLKALQVRADRALLNPAKDQEKAKLVQPFIAALSELQMRKPVSTKAAKGIDEFRWMVEEFKISVFAQELGTTFPISSKRLETQLQVCRELSS
jgi:ATP-dependent helicase HrpA